MEQQRTIEVRYDGIIVGSYCADLLVEEVVLAELKAVKTLDDIHLAQCLNYWKATGLQTCLLLNFGSPRLESKRLVNRFGSAFICVHLRFQLSPVFWPRDNEGASSHRAEAQNSGPEKSTIL